MNNEKVKLRAAVFIDHRNLVSPVLGTSVIDYKKLKQILFNGYKNLGSFIFMGVPDPIGLEKQKFIEYLNAIEYIVFPTPLIKRRDGTYEQKQVDIFMHEQMVSMAEADMIDAAILVSGDADFVVATKLVQNMNKDFIAWSWKDSFSVLLKEAVGKDNIYYIDDIWHDIKK